MVFSFFIAWLRQAQPPFRSLSLSKWYYYAGDFDKLNHRVTFDAWAESKAYSHSSSLWFLLRSITSVIFIATLGAWACRRHILILIPVISTPLNHRVAFGAWACRRHILTHTPCDFGSAQSMCCFRCLSLSKAHFHSSYLWFRPPQSPLSFWCLSTDFHSVLKISIVLVIMNFLPSLFLLG